MKNLEVFCDRCGKDVTPFDNYEITIIHNIVEEDEIEREDEDDDFEDFDFLPDDTKIIDLCEACYEKFCALNYEIMSEKKGNK
jgi:hypothetical protein